MDSRGSVTLFAVGDIMLGEEAYSYGHSVGSRIEKLGPLFPFERCVDVLKEADILFGNLEVVLSAFDKTKDPFNRVHLRGQPAAVEGLVSAGFDVLSLANNHSMQHGRKALEETMEILRKHSIAGIGIDIPQQDIENFCMLERSGLKIGFLGYNFRPQQYFLDSPLYVAGDIGKIRQDIGRVRQKVDIIVVSLHWGDEFVDHPSPDQVKLGRQIIDSGANLVLGHHPHILQGIERYHGGVIAYSLGNFVFDHWQYRLRKSMILRCDISASGEVTYDIIPVLINLSWQPEVIIGSRGEALKEEIYQLSLLIGATCDRETYDQELKRNLRRFRREVCWYYLTHLHRYKLNHIIGNLFRVVQNRISKQPIRT